MEIRKGKLLYEGKTKKVYPTNDPDHLILHFKNDVRASRGKSKETVKNKGAINNTISSLLFQFLESYHVPTHFVEVLKPDEILIKKMEMIPVEVMVWNFGTKSLNQRFGIQIGTPLACPILEFYLMEKKLKNPMITIDHACAFGYGSPEEWQDIDRSVRKVNAVLKSYFSRRELELVDFKLEFGRYGDEILVGDEISLDTCHFYDLSEQDAVHKHLLPDDAQNLTDLYQKLNERICQ